MTSSAQNSRQTLLQKGTAAVPGIAFQGDNNTGVYSPGANEIAIATNGSVALSVDSSQNVAMTNALPVGSGGTGFKTYTTGDILYASGSGTLSKLGIGSNGYVLTVNSGVPAWTAAASSGVASISFGSTGLTPSSATTGAVTVSGTLALSNGGTGSGNASGARNNLGLGSIATQDSSNVSITGGTIGGNASVSTTGNGQFGRVIATTGTGAGTGYTFTSGDASFATLGGHAFINFSAYCSMYSSDSNTKLNWEVGNTSNTQVMNITTSLFQVNSTDAAKPGGGSWIATSDVRVKKDIQDYTLSADALLTLRPVSYQYNGLYGTPENGKTYIGLIAQEVQNTPFSSMVGTYNYEGTQLLNLDTSQLVYALINAVQDLTARVKALESGAA
jgi:hypothetical protein